MPDRKKVIEQLESMRDYHRSAGNNITADIANDAVELLKEQEPQKVINQYANWDSELIGNCPKCNAILYEYDNAKACGECGQAVKWK